MSEEAQNSGPGAPPGAQKLREVRAPRALRHARYGLWLLFSLPFYGLLLVLGMLYITNRPVAAPGWVVSQIEARANVALAGTFQLRLRGGAEVLVEGGLVPRVRFLGVEILRPSGEVLALLPELRSELEREALMRGRIVLKSLRIRGARLELSRNADGTLDLDFGADNALSGAQVQNLPQALEALKLGLASSALTGLVRIEAEDMQIQLEDKRQERIWAVSAGRFSLTQDDTRITATLRFDVGEQDRLPSSVALSLTTRKASPESSFGAAVTAVPARDLALQSPALTWLSVLDAPISGSLRSGINAQGALGQLDGILEIGAGALRPVAGLAPVPLHGGSVSLSYEPENARVRFSDLAFYSPALRLRASGTAYLRELSQNLPQMFFGHVSISDLRFNPDGVFAMPVQFLQGAADLRLRLDPFTLEFGQVQLIDEAQRISASGKIAASEAGWSAALDVGTDRISQEQLLALWPVSLVPNTRSWLADNVATGDLRDVKAAIRLVPEAEPILALAYAFEGAEVRILKTLPPVLDATGFASIEGNRHILTVERGHVLAPAGGRIEVDDTVMLVPDIRIRPAPAEVRLRTQSTITAALSLLDQPPFEFLRKAGLNADLAEGMAQAETVLTFDLKKVIAPQDVGYQVRAVLTDVQSDKIVPGRVLEADRFDLVADNAAMTLSGKGRLSSIPFDAVWHQGFLAAERNQSQLEAEVQITARGLEAFGVQLPQGAVGGSGLGRLSVALARGEPAQFSFETDLRGLALEIAQAGWRKPATEAGQLTATGTLGEGAGVDVLRIDAAGLLAEGRLIIAPGGGLERAEFSRVRLSDWFDGALALRSQGANRPLALAITGGSLDLRRAKLGADSDVGAAATTAAAPIAVTLERVTVSQNFFLAGLRGEFTQRGGFSGTFSGRVNGLAPIRGTIIPAASGRSAVRITSDDAGAVLAASNIFSRARGGTLELTLLPKAETAGHFDGAVVMNNLRVRDAPVLASLLGAISGIGLLEQLSGDGLVFNEVDGEFLLTPEAVELKRGAAVGASLGVSMAGIYNLESQEIDMQGVISPFYLINSIGQVLTRRGEGLVGFNYRLSGTASQMQGSINPLSILTPGMFREIFRSAPPTLSQ